MKNSILLLSFLIIAKICFSQNWSGVVTNRVSFYDTIKSNLFDQTGFISIDSTAIVGANTEYYFCNTYRNNDLGCGTIDGASWMGSKFVHTPMGDEIYFNRLNDSILVKTQAILNDTWVLTTDTNGITYQATITAVDTMTINSIVDSVKTIQLQAYNGVTPIASIYNVNFKLSKHNGFVELIPWYAFPYPVAGGFPSIFPFTTTAKYLDSNSLFYKNYGESVAKYQPGNEWISSMDSIDGAVGFFRKRLISDSIISVQQLAGGVIAFQTLRKNCYFFKDTLVSCSTNIVNDTVFILQQNPIANPSSLLKVCQNYEIDSYIKQGVQLLFGQDSIGRNFYQYFVYQFSWDTLGISVFVNADSNGCDAIAIPLAVGGTILTKWVEHFGIVGINSNFPESEYSFSILYSKINGQVYGSKLNFAVSASQFEANVKRLNSSQLNISWNTMNESNVVHFEIERSYDAVQFYKIGKQNSKGGNFASNNYTYIDDTYAKELNGFVYYRIKMIDIDGKIFFSNVAKYELGSNHSVVVNGTIFSNQIQLSNLELNSSYQIQLMDAMGRKVYQTKVDDNKSNTFQIVGMSHLPQGIYFLNIVNVEQGKKENFKLIKTN